MHSSKKSVSFDVPDQPAQPQTQSRPRSISREQLYLDFQQRLFIDDAAGITEHKLTDLHKILKVRARALKRAGKGLLHRDMLPGEDAQLPEKKTRHLLEQVQCMRDTMNTLCAAHAHALTVARSHAERRRLKEKFDSSSKLFANTMARLL